MPVPSLRFRLRRFLVLIVLVAIGAAVWFFLIRDEGGSSEPEKEVKAKAEREPISDDPVVRKMSTAEQASQVLMLGFDGTDPGAPGVADLGTDGLGAVIVRGENWAGLDQGKKLVASLTAGGGIPPLVATSQEGGIYRALPDLPPAERELDIGRRGSADAARTWAQGASQALANAGFDLNLFPVADVATLDSPLAGRAFSDDPAEVTELTRASLEGCKAAGIACAPLHFPGLGAASQDTAEGPATVSSPLEVLTTRDLLPFAEVAKDAPAMVLSLAFYPDFDAVVPGALTPGIATDLLRSDVGFKGVAISDDLSSGAVKVNLSASDAAMQALAAGTDLIQISSPDDPGEIADAIEKAVKQGDLAPERLAEAAERVIALKRDLGVID
jgi:beta-N-acetylhexosaminidase